jgi:hypothetical protein
MFKLFGLSSRGSSGLLAGKKLLRASHVLNLPSLISERFYSLLLIRIVFSSDFSYIFFSASFSKLKKINKEKTPRLLSPLPKTKNQVTRVRRILVTAAMMAAMATMSPSKRKTLRRLTSRDKHRQNICPSWLFMYICTFI